MRAATSATASAAVATTSTDTTVDIATAKARAAGVARRQAPQGRPGAAARSMAQRHPLADLRLESLVPFPLASPAKLSQMSFAPPRCRMPLGPSRHPPSSSRRQDQPPVLTSSNLLTTLPQRFVCARLSQSYLSKSCSDFSATLTTAAFGHSILRWFESDT